MARFTRMQVLNAMYDTGLVPVFHHPDPEKAKRIADACAGGGALVVEFTNRGDAAHLIFVELMKYLQQEQPRVILGIGSVVDAPTAALYINNGANFVVGPMLNAEVARLCNRRKIPYCPGCGSVSEISEAEALGVEIVKVFPGGQLGGPSFVKAVRAPMPWTSIMPTGGVDPTRESIFSWIEAGAACLGIGSKLISKDLVGSEDWTALRGRVKECLQFVKEARAGRERR
jgi:2-dehydro-3-deoxyphosphogluconate aldolase/(4S)-4-hydroxy-2-oxoglutarate aldolase